MDDDVAIKVEHVSKTFRLPHEKHSSLKSFIINFYRQKRTFEKQRVLKDISFEVKKGEFFGIVGRNGSGKSTLLKLLAGIYSPDQGVIHINGMLTPFIELGVGFNPELTGRENVFLNGALLGFNRQEMEMMYNEIVEFAELERFMDQKLKNYSSGMQVRLAFSIAIQSKADVFVFDEVLAVGDAAFQQKCREYFAELKQSNKTIILVTHDMESVRTFCDRGFVIEKGNILAQGRNDLISQTYEELFLSEQNERLDHENEINSHNDAPNEAISTVVYFEQARAKTTTINAKEPFSIIVQLSGRKDLSNLNIGINIINEGGVIVIATNLVSFDQTITNLPNGKKLCCTFTFEPILTNGVFYVNVAAEDYTRQKLLLKKTRVSKFKVTGNTFNNQAAVNPRHKLKVTLS